MSELDGKASKNKQKILIILVVLVALGGTCLCISFAVAGPAFVRYINKSKATEATMNVHKIATGAKLAYETSPDCRFPASAGPLPPLQDCCAEVCRREEAETQDPGWTAVNFDTLGMHRYRYETVSEGDRYIVRASADLDCDGERSEYVREVTGQRGADGTCSATVGQLIERDPLE